MPQTERQPQAALPLPGEIREPVQAAWGLAGLAGATFVYQIFAAELIALCDEVDGIRRDYERDAELFYQEQDRPVLMDAVKAYEAETGNRVFLRIESDEIVDQVSAT